MSKPVRLPRNYARDFYEFAPENLNVTAHGWRDLTAAEKRQWLEKARKHYAAGYAATENRSRGRD